MNFFQDYWWRFDRYEIHNGYIGPALGAKIERYEPWKECRALSGKNPIIQPYHSLLELATAIDDASQREALALTITEWCNNHGLLGVLPHRAEMIVLDRERGTSRRFYRETGGWRAISTQEQLQPGVFMRRMGSFEIEFAPLSTYGRFFPNIPQDGFRYPCPFSDGFWRDYAEPLADFIQAVRLFKAAVDGLRNLGGRKKPDSSALVDRSTLIMQSLTAPVHTIPYIRRNQFAVGWACYSLLSSFAMMATFDLASSRMLRCVNQACGLYFVTQARKAKYCSTRCRSKIQMRNYRKGLIKRQEK